MKSSEDRRVDFDEAKGLSLSEFLEAQLGVPARRVGSGLRLAACPKCGHSSDKHSTKVSVSNDDRSWCCHSCGEGGSILDAAMSLWNCSVVEAAQQLLGVRQQFKPAPPKVDPEIFRAQEVAKAALMRKAFGKLQRATAEFVDEAIPLNYLVNERKIPLEIVREAQKRGMVGFLPGNPARASEVLVKALGESLLRETGLWKPDRKLPGIVYRPLVFFLPSLSSAEFRLTGEVKAGWTKSIRYGPLEYPYWWQGEQRQCMIVEGMIDLLSAVALGWKGHVMGLTGCNSFHQDWFTKAQEKHSLQRFVIALDNDVESKKNPGQMWARNLQEILKSLGIPSFIRTPEKGDINDILKERGKAAG